MAVNTITMSLLMLYSGRFADKFSRKGLVILGSVISLVFMGLIPLVYSLWYLLGIVLLHSVGGAISQPAVTALLVGEGRKFGMGSSMAIFFMAMSIGMTIGPIISGVIVDLVDINSTFYFAAVMGAVGTGLFIWFTR